MTVDGGQTWQPVTGPPVESLEAADSRVVRVVYDHSGCPGPCNRTVQEASAGSTAWRTLLQIPQGGDLDTAALVLSGSQAIYLPIYGDPAKGIEEAALFRSLDAGQTWDNLEDPCGAGTSPSDAAAIEVAAAPGGVLAALCLAWGETSGTVVISSDAGSTWGLPLPLPVNPGLIAASTSSDLVVGSPPSSGEAPATFTLSVSTDGGREWTTAASDSVNRDFAPLGGSLYLGFEDATTGRWVGDDQEIWTTTDGGSSWTARRFVIA